MKRILIIIFILNAFLFAQKNRMRIAILELQVNGINHDEGITLTNRLQNELAKTGSFTVLERSEMEDILNEQGLQLSGCTSDECAVQAGKLLNVQQIVAGSIGKVGSLYAINLRLISVETGQIIKPVSEDCQCPIERILTESIPNVALKLAGRMPTGGIFGSEQGKGDIFIKTYPPGSKIYLDNKYTGKSSPCTLQEITSGKHFIKAVKDNYIGTKTIMVKANDILRENLRLDVAKGGLKVYSEPPEAEVIIDGKSFGKTPKIIKELSVGEHQIVFKLPQYAQKVATARVVFNQFARVNVRLKKLADIDIQSEPSGAKIYIGNKSYGKTPQKIKAFPSGNYKVLLQKKNYVPYEESLHVYAGNDLHIFAHLKKYTELYIHSDPSGAKIYINGKPNGKTPRMLKAAPDLPMHIKLSKVNYADWEKTITLTEGVKMHINPHLEKEKGTLVLYDIPDGSHLAINGKRYSTLKKEIALPVGRYVINVSRPGFIDKSFSVDIHSNQKRAFYAALKKKTRGGAFVRSFFIPGWGQSYQDKTTRGWLFRLGFAGSVTGAYYFTQRFLKAQKNDWPAEKINSIKKNRDLFYQATAAIWLLNVLDALILPPTWNNYVRVTDRISNEQDLYGIGVLW